MRIPDKYDWGKLKRVLRYVRRAINLTLTLMLDSLIFIKWWVGDSYVAHTAMRGHVGATILLRRGSITGISNKHRIDIKSSTETALIRSDNNMPQMLWTLYFIKAQGFIIDKSVLFQDNLRTMLFERNGMASRSKRKKHIRVRYYFIKDHISMEDMVLKHCPTG